MLVDEVRGGRLANASQQFTKTGSPDRSVRTGSMLMKKPTMPNSLGPIAPLDRHTDDDVRIARAAVEEGVQCRKPREVRARLLPPGHFEERLHEFRWEGAVRPGTHKNSCSARRQSVGSPTAAGAPASRVRQYASISSSRAPESVRLCHAE